MLAGIRGLLLTARMLPLVEETETWHKQLFLVLVTKVEFKKTTIHNKQWNVEVRRWLSSPLLLNLVNGECRETFAHAISGRWTDNSTTTVLLVMVRTLPWLNGRAASTKVVEAHKRPIKRQRVIDPNFDTDDDSTKDVSSPRRRALTRPGTQFYPYLQWCRLLIGTERTPSTSPPPAPPSEE